VKGQHGVSKMESGLQLDVLYQDSDLAKIRVSASNDVFGGTADVYLGLGQLAEVAAQLEGFPTGFEDSREITLGSFEPQSAGGGVSMRFYCVDRSGHAYVETKIESDQDSAGKVQSAILLVPIEASAVDLFVDELRRVNSGKATTACLKTTAPVR
jgi:hypothetical protein